MRVSAIVADGENVDMQIALELPEDIAKRLELAWRDVSRGLSSSSGSAAT
jgi:hypothetical protein